VRWHSFVITPALCSSLRANRNAPTGTTESFCPIMRILLSHAGPRPWIGRWPPPARALAGRKDGREMRRKRSSTLFRRLTMNVVVAGILALAFYVAAPNCAWARVAPTTVVSGDPTVGDEGPSPGPKKAAGTSKTLAIGPAQTGSQYRVLKLSWTCIAFAWARTWLRFGLAN